METKPVNVFAQIMQALKIMNDNIITLSDNVTDMAKKIEEISQMMVTNTEPIALGAETPSTTIESITNNSNQNGL